MALTDYVIMPGADYLDACNAIRESTGGTDAIKSGDLGPEIRRVADMNTGGEDVGPDLETCSLTVNWDATGAASRTILGVVWGSGLDAESKKVSTRETMFQLKVGESGTVRIDNLLAGSLVSLVWAATAPVPDVSISLGAGMVSLWSSPTDYVCLVKIEADAALRIQVSG